MEKFKFKGIQIHVYYDLLEFGLKYLEVPKGCEPDYESSDKTGGVTIILDNFIAFYVHPKHDFDDLLATVSHELGHLITNGYTENPPDEDKYFDEHEKKAEHYENFVIDAYNLTKKIQVKF